MLMPSQVTSDAFEAWLKAKGPTAIVGYANLPQAQCPISTFLREHHEIEPTRVSLDFAWYAARPEDQIPGDSMLLILPSWARRFQVLMQLQPGDKPVSSRMCLRTLELAKILWCSNPTLSPSRRRIASSRFARKDIYGNAKFAA